MRIVRDISHYNIIANYDLFRSSNQEVQIKITESTNFSDARAEMHHSGCFGMPRAPYHFARPVSIPDQIRWFLRQKSGIGQWERPDMLDCEFAGVNSAFIKALVAEYRKQSGITKVQVYLGLHDVTTTCLPNGWWDKDVYMQVARYRKIGPPNNPNDWSNHLGFDHPGLSTYQWDNATPFYPNGPIGDISYDRTAVVFTNQPTPPKPVPPVSILGMKEDMITFLTCATPNRSAVLLANGKMIDITDDLRTRQDAQRLIDAGKVNEFHVSDATWQKFVTVSNSI